ncbi:MAG: ATP synthase F1 subunit gamma [Bacteroidetes bacterium]|nr:ATP synthase F1 subunit gamma [Bacteroidota bacterium]
MANLKETRSRIVSIKSTMQITSAMKMVSAAKLKRAQDAITQMRPYAEKLQEILSNVSDGADDIEGSAFSKFRPVKKVLIIAVTSNRGLCGGFNSSISKHIVTLLKGEYAELNAAGNVEVLAIGKKAGDFFKTKNVTKIAAIKTDIWNALNFQNSSVIAEEIMSDFAAGKYDEVKLVYNTFKNAATQTVKTESFLPIQPSALNTGNASNKDYIFEPNKEEIIVNLIPKALKTQFYKALLDSMAGEHGARMTSMHKATDNAKQMAKDLTLQYNKARQAAITNEILEIVGGAEALNN